MRQDGIIDSMVDALWLNNELSKVKLNPALVNTLVKDKDGLPISGTFSYNSFVGILLYLDGRTYPEISYVVNYYTIYMFEPRHSYELKLNRVGHSLKATRDNLLMLNPSSSLCKVYSFPDSVFVGFYGNENTADPVCVKIIKAFEITFENCPVLCQINISDKDFPVYYGAWNYFLDP